MYTIKWAPDFDHWFRGIRDRPTRIRLLRRLEKAQRGLFGDVAPVGDGVYRTAPQCSAYSRVAA